MRKTALLVTALAIALAGMLHAGPAQAQRVFVSGSGLDTNPCTFASPCRSFQQAFNTVAAAGEIDVLDPAGYGPLTITHGISIQGHDVGGVTQSISGANAITINAGNAAITLNGLIIDGAGTGADGIDIVAAASVQILDCVIHHFANNGIEFQSSTNPTTLLVSNTVVSDSDYGILLELIASNSTNTTLNATTVNQNNSGVDLDGGIVMITNSVLSNNNDNGLFASAGTAWLEKTAATGNGIGVIVMGGTVNSYGDNDINGNMTMDVSGSLTPASTR